MKKTYKRILQGISIAIVIIVLLLIGYGIKTKSELKKMTPIETKEIVDNIFSIKDTFVNLFLIKDGDQYIAIDGGKDADIVLEGFKKLNINPNDVSTILLTHTDFDHVAAIKLFKNAKVFFSKQEEILINKEKTRFPLFYNKIDTEDYTLLEDQQVIQIGDLKVKCILTPGHTLGSMCYLINDKYLFTGDILSIINGKIDKFNEFFNMDTEMAIKSMELITKLPAAEYIFSAHYGYSDDYKNAVNDWGN